MLVVVFLRKKQGSLSYYISALFRFVISFVLFSHQNLPNGINRLITYSIIPKKFTSLVKHLLKLV